MLQQSGGTAAEWGTIGTRIRAVLHKAMLQGTGIAAAACRQRDGPALQPLLLQQSVLTPCGWSSAGAAAS